MSDGSSAWRSPNLLQIGLVLTVAASGGLVALSVGAPVAGVLVATIVAGIVGVGLTAYLTRIAPDSGGTYRRPPR